MNDSIEQLIQSKGPTAPRVTPAEVEAEISKEMWFTAGEAARGLNLPCSPSDDLLTFCVLTLRNGFTVTGESACASPENFDADIGRKIARDNAVAKIWPLLGFRLRDDLAAHAMVDTTNAPQPAQETFVVFRKGFEVETLLFYAYSWSEAETLRDQKVSETDMEWSIARVEPRIGP